MYARIHSHRCIYQDYTGTDVYSCVYFHSTNHMGPFYEYGLPLIPAWISDHILYKVCDEMDYPLPNCKMQQQFKLGYG